MARKNMSWDDMKTGGKFLAGSILLEALLLAPKKDVKVGGKTITLQGLFPLSQKYVATFAEGALNEALPKAAEIGASLLLKTKIEPFVRDKILWLLYDFLDKYSLNSLVSLIFDKTSFLEGNKFSSALRTYLEDIIKNKDGRDNLVQNLTNGILNAIQVLADGTIFSVLINDRVASVIKETASAILEHLVNSDAGNSVAEKLLEAVEHLESLTVASFLTNNLGIPRESMGQMIDTFYDKYLGKTMVQSLRDQHLGSQAYFNLSNLDYNAFFNELWENHLDELLRVAIGGASAGMYLLSSGKSAKERAANAKAFAGKIKGMRSGRKNRRSGKKAIKDIEKVAENNIRED